MFDALGPLEGIRMWRQSDARLFSLGWDEWDVVPRAAECRFRLSPGQHRAPDIRCGCGYYAVADVDALAQVGLGFAPVRDASCVIGLVKGWGRAIPHARGWRAEFAKPIGFYELTGLFGRVRPYVIVNESGAIPLDWNREYGRSPLVTVAKRYGVPRLLPPPGLRALVWKGFLGW
jgi:hypothetical protein